MTTRPITGGPAAFVRGWLVSLVANLPILVIMLIPQLTRSRAGSSALLAIGASILIALTIAALVAAPVISTWAAPQGGWQPGSARAEVRSLVGRAGRRVLAIPLLGFVLLYAASQIAGAGIAWMMPYISADPAGGWTINYFAFAVQALTVYLVVCAATAWFGYRVRSEVLAR